MELVDIIEVNALLGECALWCERTQALWFTDIEGRALYRRAGRQLERFPVPERLASFGFLETGDGLIAGFESGIALYHPGSGEIAWLERHGLCGIRLNDGRVDRQGRFWIGAMAETKEAAGTAPLYCFDGACRIAERGISISNSLCWNRDGTRLYLADSPRRTIWRYAFDAATGTLSNREIFAQVPGKAMPDGSTVDAEDHLWNAEWGSGRVVRYAPDGRLDLVLEVAARQVTSVAFGGPSLSQLFVTTAKVGLAPAPVGAGNVFVYDTEFTGLPECRYRGAARAFEG